MDSAAGMTGVQPPRQTRWQCAVQGLLQSSGKFRPTRADLAHEPFEECRTLMDVFVQVLTIGAGLLTAMGVGTGIAGWLVVRKLRRSHTLERVRERSALTVHAYSPDKTTRAPARLIMTLRRASRATQLSLDEAVANGRPVGELPHVASGLDQAMASLENLLHAADREPNAALKQEWMNDLSVRAKTLNELSAELRRCLMHTSRSVDSAQLQQATSRLTREVSAMRTWRASYGNR